MVGFYGFKSEMSKRKATLPTARLIRAKGLCPG